MQVDKRSDEPHELVDVQGGRHEDDLDSARVGVDELFDQQAHEVKVFFAIVNLVQDDVGPRGDAP